MFLTKDYVFSILSQLISSFETATSFMIGFPFTSQWLIYYVLSSPLPKFLYFTSLFNLSPPSLSLSLSFSHSSVIFSLTLYPILFCSLSPSLSLSLSLSHVIFLSFFSSVVLFLSFFLSFSLYNSTFTLTILSLYFTIFLSNAFFLFNSLT